jgi:hypothetical protein
MYLLCNHLSNHASATLTDTTPRTKPAHAIKASQIQQDTFNVDDQELAFLIAVRFCHSVALPGAAFCLSCACRSKSKLLRWREEDAICFSQVIHNPELLLIA